MANSEKWLVRLQNSPVIVMEVPKARRAETPEESKKRKVRRYSQGPLTFLGVVEDRVLGGLTRSASAYRSRRDSSAAKRRDGAILDFPENIAQAPEKFIVQVSRIPRDLIRSRTNRRMRQRMRKPIVNLLRW